jgi:hypothetical protein
MICPDPVEGPNQEGGKQYESTILALLDRSSHGRIHHPVAGSHLPGNEESTGEASSVNWRIILVGARRAEG